MQQLVTNYLSQQTGTAALWIGVLSVVVFIVVRIKKAVSAVWPFVKKLVTVVEDLFGSEARPGVEARPGLMERMKTSEENDVQILATVAEHSQVLLELQPNHGGSMKDVLNSALRALTEQGEAISRQGEALTEQGKRADRLEEALTSHINEQRAAVSNAESAATGAREAVIGAQEAAVGAREAVVGARAAVVSAEAAVVAAVADRASVNVHVTAGS